MAAAGIKTRKANQKKINDRTMSGIEGRKKN
jgi:hypothetical protein